ncbi:hypothetical protein Tco_0649681 [Tanacetum coccineum]
MFCGSLDSETKNAISTILPFKEGKLPVRYLGVPLVTKKIGVRGSVFLLPKTVINDIEKLFKKFLWNNGESCKGKPKVAWVDVCKPKDQGGLGFKSLELWNKTLLVKYLWNVASKKESLWVKWINVVKLKNRSVWDVAIDPKYSWGWKCILNLRNMVRDHIRFSIGNGKSVNVWHDNWNSERSLASMISKKEIFYAGFKDQDCIADLRVAKGWKWPPEWIIKFPWLKDLQDPVLSNYPDKPIWVDNDGNTRRFSTATVWRDIRGNGVSVDWKDIKLSTQDKMIKWYPNRVFERSLCKTEADSHDHLFFKCEFAEKIWKKVCVIARINVKENKWDDIIKAMSLKRDNKSIWGIIRRLCLAAMVYYIWQERKRLFNNCKRTDEEVFGVICDEVRSRLTTIPARNTTSINMVEKFSRKN